ncbi:hypothetical protein Tco_0557337 [Tanacetum coccineum]
MVDTGQEEETFDPLEIGMDLFFYESPACLEFKQRTRSYGNPNLQDEIAEPISFLPDIRGLVKRWHVCKPIHVTYNDGNGEDCRMWSTCDPDSKFCFGYNEVFGVNEHGALTMWICFRDHERRTMKGSYMGFADFIQELVCKFLTLFCRIQKLRGNSRDWLDSYSFGNLDEFAANGFMLWFVSVITWDKELAGRRI